jgi:hypothetical protein
MRRRRKKAVPALRWPLVVAALATTILLAACSSEPTVETIDPVSVQEATATSRTSVTIRFAPSADPSSAGSPAAYRITRPDGARLDVLDARPSPDGSQVVLVTAPQQLVRYDLSVRGLGRADGLTPTSTASSEPVAFAGSDVPAPVLLDAMALDPTRVLVRFADPATGTPVAMGDAAADPAHYVLSPEGPTVLGAAFARGGSDRTRVIVTTTPLTGGTYTLAVHGLAAASPDVPLDPNGSGAEFVGIAEVDTAAPNVLEVVAHDPETVVVRFSEPVGPGAADDTAYGIVDGDGAEVPVSRAVLNDVATEATLTTWPMAAGGEHELSVAGVSDLSLNPVAPNATVFRVPTGDAPDDTTPPRVVGASSTGPTSVVVTFDEPVAGGLVSAENPGAYEIVDVARTGELSTQAILLVQDAVLSASGRSVTLTTLTQSEIEYAVRVTGVRDRAGNLIVGPDRENPYQVTFFGTGSVGPAVDSDGDGLSDAAEQAGWTVRILRSDGTVVQRTVTSDPFVADTDDDGVPDLAESIAGTDPRSGDSDGDDLGDFAELNQVYSDPTQQDSDGDGLQDGLEFDFFRTSPILADTDGDQLLDGDEVTFANRDQRVADLPLPAIEVGAIDLSLDTRFSATSSEGTRELESKTTSTTLTQTESQAFSNTDSNAHEFMAKVSAGGEYAVGGDAGLGAAKGSFNVEAGYTGQWTSSFTRESSQESQQAFEASTTTDVETTREESITREVVGASMRATITLRNLGSIAFTISNVQVTAFVLDPDQPDRLIPVATLTPQSEPVGGYNLGPLIPQRGPLVFESSEVFPSTIEQLMRDPRGLVFKVANFDITDEFGRNFAFTSQDINDRTAPLVLDFGGYDEDGDGEGESSARYRIATSAGRVIGDVNGDGVVDEEDRTVFGPNGDQVGITLREALEDVLGLTRYDEDVVPTSSLDVVQQENSYSVRYANGVATLWRVGTVTKSASNPLRTWEVITPEGIDRTIDFDERLLRTEDGITLAFVMDEDDDRVTARWEYMLGCSDQSIDSDDDGISDYDEIYVGWQVDVAGRGVRQVYSSCARTDSDLDGLTDDEERTLGLHPARADSDEDGVSDFDEVNGYDVELRFPFEAGTSTCTATADPAVVRCTSDPLFPDTDGDGLDDGDERRLGTDPTVSDGDRAFDDDGDGLVNFEETDGWTVTFEGVSTTPFEAGPTVVCTPTSATGCGGAVPTSDTDDVDTDGDGISDRYERDLGTNPRDPDTDGDGLTDAEEVAFVPAEDRYELVYDPLDADIDDDGRSDFEELNDAIVVRVDGEDPRPVFSDPFLADADNDLLADSDEATFGTDPTAGGNDTDGDGTDDRIEVLRNQDLDPFNDTNPLKPDQLLEIAFDGRGVAWDFNGLICGDVSASKAEFNADLAFTVNAQETGNAKDVTWTTAWSNFGTWTRIYEGGPITARGGVEALNTAYDTIGSPFSKAVVATASGYQQILGTPQEVFTLKEFASTDECTVEVRFTITPIMTAP